MVLFGAYHTAERFFDDDRLTAHFPGPGSYAVGSTVLVEGGVRYARKLVEDGVARPNGSPIVFRERDSWVRGKEGPQGLTSLSAGNDFVSPATYSTESGERATRRTRAPAAVIHTLEPRYLSPSTRCITPDHERAAKGVQSPGPGTYYPSFEAWDFAPPEEWTPVNKAATACRTPRSRRFNTKLAWGEPSAPRPPDTSRAAQKPTKEERAWLSERRGPIRPRTSPRCMWVQGVCTRRGLQAWGDVATRTGPIHVGYNGDVWDQQNPRRGPPGPKPSGPVYSCEARATSPGFREARYLSRDLMRRCVGTAMDTPGPGQYDVRVPLRRGTSFAGPRPSSSKTATVGAFIESAKLSASDERRADRENRSSGARRRSWPSPPPARSQRLSAPLIGRESPGPAYNLPSDFDPKLVNKKKFHPPSCGGGTKSTTGVPSKRARRATRFRKGNIRGLRRELSDLVANSRGGTAGKVLGGGVAGKALGVPVSTSLGRGFLLRIRADGMTFVRLPWGVLYTTEVLTHGNVVPGRECVDFEHPGAAPNIERGCVVPEAAAVGADGRVDASPAEEHVKCNARRPPGGA